jgi:undecaprenyl-diphosphatase
MELSRDKKWSLALHRTGDEVMPIWKFLSIYGGFLYVAFFTGLFIASFDRDRLLLLTVLSLGITIALTFLIRYIVRRPRPFFMEKGYIPWLNDYSFPSAHASVVFAVAALESWLFLTPLLSTAGIILTILAIGVACLIAISRVMLGVHYIGDIVVGALLGTFVSGLVMYLL